MVSDCTFQVCTPSVVGEVIDGEAIVMDLRTGAYYSADALGGAIWKAIEDGASRQEIISAVVAAYPDVRAAADEAETFLKDLVTRDLIREAPLTGATPAFAAPTDAYKRPALDVHEDMQDLILLDPIHDVAEMGWPTRKAEVG